MEEVPSSRAPRADEPRRGAARTVPGERGHVRLGLPRRSLAERYRESQVVGEDRPVSPYRNIGDLYRRARTPVDDLTALARAGALAGLEPDRRKALWAVHGLSRQDRPEQLLLPLADPAPAPALQQLSEMERINWDWRESGHSPRAHLLEPFRKLFTAQGWPLATAVNALADGRRTDYVGLVICRQRPHTAKGVTFLTLEDETGFVNLVVWQAVWDRFKVPLRSLSVMGVSGRIQAEDGVTHLVVDRAWEPQLAQAPATTGSRDFR